MLSPLLAGEKTSRDIMINDFDWYTEPDHPPRRQRKEVVRIDRKRKIVFGKDGTEAPTTNCSWQPVPTLSSSWFPAKT